MRILFAHNQYRFTGGEDSVFSGERDILRQHGHSVTELLWDNRQIGQLHPLRIATDAVWSSESPKRLAASLDSDRWELAHFHNTFPRVSPSAYFFCKSRSIPVVQELQNFRFLCPAATFYRDGAICEECLGRSIPWPGVLHGCYHHSRSHTAVIAGMIAFHRLRRTWQSQVDAYIAPSEFTRAKYLQGGFPPEKIFVRPNPVVPDPGVRRGQGSYALFVGRITPEKGIRTVLDAWQTIGDIPLKIVGEGPSLKEIRRRVDRDGMKSVEVLGPQPREAVFPILKEARFLLYPSHWYETFGITIAEAFACGVPVIASGIGAMAENVADGRTGWLCAPGNPEELAARVDWAWTHPAETSALGSAARREYEVRFSTERNYPTLMSIYAAALRGGEVRA